MTSLIPRHVKKNNLDERQIMKVIEIQERLKTEELKKRGLSDREIYEQVIQMTIFNHGVPQASQYFKLPFPKIKSIFYRTDCWDRCLVAAKQMIKKGEG